MASPPGTDAPGPPAVGALDQTQVARDVLAHTGVAAGQVVLGADDGEPHEVLHPVGEAGQLSVRGDAYQPVVSAGLEAAAGGVDVEPVHVLEGHVFAVGVPVDFAVGVPVDRGPVSGGGVRAATG
jgi:hypothetical protein